MFLRHGFRLNKQVYRLDYADRKRDFELLGLIGEGAFGKVWKVHHRLTKETYALKIMDKAKILSKKCVKEIMNERQILGDLLSDPSDFIVNIRGAFQDSHKLFILMACIEGLDLRRYMAQGHTLTE
jgi:serine/threonine protein kinase